MELGHEDYSFAISLPTGPLLPCRQTFPNPAKTLCAGEKSLQADLKFYLPWRVRRPESPCPLLTRVYTRAAESSGRGKYKGYAILLVGHCFCPLFLLCLYGNGRRGGQGLVTLYRSQQENKLVRSHLSAQHWGEKRPVRTLQILNVNSKNNIN